MSRGASLRRNPRGWAARRRFDSLPLVTVDTSVALPATLRAGGMPRKFRVLLAFDGLVYEAEHRRLDLDALRLEADATGGRSAEWTRPSA